MSLQSKAEALAKELCIPLVEAEYALGKPPTLTKHASVAEADLAYRNASRGNCRSTEFVARLNLEAAIRAELNITKSPQACKDMHVITPRGSSLITEVRKKWDDLVVEVAENATTAAAAKEVYYLARNESCAKHTALWCWIRACSTFEELSDVLRVLRGGTDEEIVAINKMAAMASTPEQIKFALTRAYPASDARLVLLRKKAG